MSKQLFKQNEDGNFIPVGYEFTGWPANGVWLVEDGKQSCIYEMGPKPSKPSPSLVSYMVLQEDLQKEISKKWEEKALSVRDISMLACEFFALRAGGMKLGEEIIEN
jgi:hypothetical protein